MHNLEELAFKHMSRNEENVSVSLFFYVCFCEPSIGELKRSFAVNATCVCSFLFHFSPHANQATSSVIRATKHTLHLSILICHRAGSSRLQLTVKT